MNDNANLSKYLGLNIEKLRSKRNLSQLQLARLADLPRSTLTNMESGAGNPSLSNLLKLSQALGVGVEELLSRPRSDCVLIKEEEVEVQTRSRGQVQIFKLLPDKIKGLDIDRLEFAPGVLMGGHPHLAGTKEYLTVLQGEISVHVAGDQYIVKKGDVLAFPGNQPHSYRNSGRGTATAISIVVPVPASV